MAFPSVTYTFTNGTTADATQVNQNFTDLINGSSDGTKSHSISALTCGSTATFQSAVILGNATGNDITFNGSLASSMPIKTNTSFDIGTATIGLRAIYIGGTSTFTTKIQGGTQSGSLSYTLPTSQQAGYMYNDNTGTLTWAAKQIAVGTAITSSVTTASATFAAFSASTPTITFTPTRTATFEIYGSFPTANNTLNASVALRINATAGSPTVTFSQEAFANTAVGSDIQMAYVFQIVQLTAGVSYTFQLEGKVSSGTASLRGDAPTNGCVLVAKEL